MKKKSVLTQKELVVKMRRLGFEDVTERRLIDWRRKSLLPPFDGKGNGFGRGKGRAASFWKDGRAIVERAVWVYRLLGMYSTAGNVYLPLWTLGYSVPSGLVRSALVEPLESLNEFFRSEAIEELEAREPYERRDGIVEDYIGDLTFNWMKNDRITAILGLPSESIEAALNIFFNPDYKLGDIGFEDGREQLEVWKERVNDHILPTLSEGLGDVTPNESTTIRPEGIEIVFERPSFFQEYLSLAALSSGISLATEKDLEDAQRDMLVVGSIAESLAEAMTKLMEHMPSLQRPTLEQVLPDVFKLTHLLVLADLSFRTKGFGSKLDIVRDAIKAKIAEGFPEIDERELEQAGPALQEAFETGIETLKKNFERLVANHEPVHQAA